MYAYDDPRILSVTQHTLVFILSHSIPVYSFRTQHHLFIHSAHNITRVFIPHTTSPVYSFRTQHHPFIHSVTQHTCVFLLSHKNTGVVLLSQKVTRSLKLNILFLNLSPNKRASHLHFWHCVHLFYLFKNLCLIRFHARYTRSHTRTCTHTFTYTCTPT
jgi:hypothetical protein